MRVLFIINSLQEKAGSERVACQLANLFHLELGYDVTLVNRFASREESAFDVDVGIDYQCIKGNSLSFYNQLQSIIDRNDYNIIIVHNMGKISLLCSLLNTREARLISLEHVAFSSRSKWIQYLSRVLYRKFDSIITLTERDRLEYVNWHPNVIKISNISPYHISNRDCFEHKKIIAIGRLTYQKNFIALINAWEKIFEKLPGWSIDIYGKGEDEYSLREYIKKNEINNIYLKGVASNMQDIYKDASFLVMSSRYEGLPMVLIEAQSFGLPIISFDCPYGPREIIEHNKTGLLVQDQNIKELSEAIYYLSTHEDILQEYSKNTTNLANRYSSVNILSEWKEKVLLA